MISICCMFRLFSLTRLVKLLDDEDDNPPRKLPHRSHKRKDSPPKGGISESDLDTILAATAQDFTKDDPDFTLTEDDVSQPPEKASRKDPPRRASHQRKYKGVPKTKETPEKDGEEPDGSQRHQDLVSITNEQVDTCITSLAWQTNTANAF